MGPHIEPQEWKEATELLYSVDRVILRGEDLALLFKSAKKKASAIMRLLVGFGEGGEIKYFPLIQVAQTAEGNKAIIRPSGKIKFRRGDNIMLLYVEEGKFFKERKMRVE